MDPLSPALTQISFLNPTTSIIIIVCLIFFAGLLAASETALSKCNRYKIQTIADDGNKKAKIVLDILEKYDNSIIDTLIWINVCHIVASTVATLFMISLFDNQDLASLLSTVIMTLLLFFFSELLPKNIANLNPDKVAIDLAIMLKVLGIVVFPVAIIFRGLIGLLKKIFKVNDSDNSLSEDDFQDTVEDIAEDGLLEDEEVEIIQNAVDFGDITVMKVLTKAEDVVAIDESVMSKEDILKFVQNVKFTRIPVYSESLNNIIGVLHVKKYLLALSKNKNISLKRTLYKPLFVSPNTSLDDCVDIFQEKHNHIAFVKDDKDAILGMITLEDVVEELVGDIDEANPPKLLLKGGKK